jgi:ornithine cyclodeaminase/alanine dehydrogenase-like protein (mu-crystallin family)
LLLCGCGAQADAQFAAVAAVRPLRHALVYDRDGARAAEFVRRWSPRCCFNLEAVSDLAPALPQADMVVTCTTSERYFIEPERVSPGTFIAAVGADSESKQELSPQLVTASKLVCDSATQCAGIGELHHAVAAGLMGIEDVWAELGTVVAGRAKGQVAPSDVVIFDSTGLGLQDVAAAAVAYERALADGSAPALDFAGAGA